MATHIFINGMGTIGRAIFKQAMADKRFDIVGVNDPNMTAGMMAYLLNYDSLYGGLAKSEETEVVVQDGSVIGEPDALAFGIPRTYVPVYAETDYIKIPTGELNAEIVLECTGTMTSQSQAQDFINNGAKFALICYPTKEGGLQIVHGINDSNWQGSIAEMASCTTQAASVLLNVIRERFGIKSAIVKSVHAYTADQQITEGADNSNPERGRAAAVNIVPTVTSASKAIGKVVPDLNGKVIGQAFRVPVLCGSAVDIAFELEKEGSVTDINTEFKSYADDEMLSCTEQPLVSSDIIGSPVTVTFLAKQTVMLGGTHGNIVGLYDNVTGFAHAALEIAAYKVQGIALMMYNIYTSAMPLSMTDEERTVVPFDEFDWRPYYDSVKDELMQAYASEDENGEEKEDENDYN